MMKFSTILVALAYMTPTVTADKPMQSCRGNNAPSLSLGGYNVDVSTFPDFDDMIDDLWQKELLGHYNATIEAFSDFDPSDKSASVVGNLSSGQKDGIWRGVGVEGQDGEQISGSESVCVNFGGLVVKELFFGARDLVRQNERPRRERGSVFLYNDNMQVGEDRFSADTVSDDDDDGQQQILVRSREVFDTICFITRSHPTRGNGNAGHNYFLEYIDLCSSTGKPENTCPTSGTEPNFYLGGYDVRVSDYPEGIDMIEGLWRKHLDDQFSVEIHPLETFSRRPRTVPDLGDDNDFGFEQKDGIYWRGVGVNITGNETISEREGIYIHFGGLTVKELFLGTRSQFTRREVDRNEVGRVFLYSNGNRVGREIIRADDYWDVDDGQEHFFINSTEEFDSIVVTTRIQANTTNEDRGEFFLEYVDLCCPPDASVKGDPHFKTWDGKYYDYHGVCDLVLLQNDEFESSLGMDIHIRTMKMKQWSFISNAALRIGEDVLEVKGDKNGKHILYWINGLAGREDLSKNELSVLSQTISGYPITYKKLSSKQHELTVHIGNDEKILMATWKELVRVDIHGATHKNFGKSLGLMGTFGKGIHIARDKKTVIQNINVFGQEWQVQSDKLLFHNVDGPQFPQQCVLPSSSDVRRRLGESSITYEEAAIACSRVNEKDRQVCIFDVMATGDRDIAGAY